jgi:hypothetical protein
MKRGVLVLSTVLALATPVAAGAGGVLREAEVFEGSRLRGVE